MVSDPISFALQKHQIDINSPVNGVWLKGGKSPSEWAGPLHKGRHKNDYGTVVSERLREADRRGGKAAVEEELMSIRNELFEDPNFGGLL